MPITTCLTLNGVAEEAAEFYVSILHDARITGVTRHTPESAEVTSQPSDSVLVVHLEAEGHRFMCLNAGPSDPMGLAISLMLERDSQEGIDQLWDALADGGTERECGWVTDRYGVAWQVVPSQWAGLVGGPDQDGARRAMQAMLTMTKLDIAALQEAYEGTGTHA